MLHILWMIIKVILVILAVLLGLILLAVLLVLFCPVTYQARAEKGGRVPLKEIQAEGRVSWLFRAISLHVVFADGKWQTVFCVFGVSIKKILGMIKRPGRSSQKQPEPSSSEDPLREAGVRVPGVPEESPKEEPAAASPSESAEIPAPPENEKPQPEEIPEEPESEEKQVSGEEDSSGVFTKILQKGKAVFGFPGKLYKKIQAAIHGVFEKIRKIKLTIQNICGKINWWKQLAEDARTQEAISLVLTDGRKLIRHILPNRITGKIVFDSEDPSVTGAVLAVLGMSVPFHRNCIAVTPLFENENYLEGNVRLKGRLFGFVFLKAAIEIYFNKNVKYVIYRWKHKEA